MAGPLAAISFIHNPMRRDLKEVATEAHELGAERESEGPTEELIQLQQRYRLWRRVLEVHEDGEEQFLFPALDAAAPGTSEAYREAHKRVATARADVAAALDEGDTHQVHGLLHRLEHELNDHLDQEEQELLPLAEQHLSQPDQAAIAGKMGAHVPSDFFQEGPILDVALPVARRAGRVPSHVPGGRAPRSVWRHQGDCSAAPLSGRVVATERTITSIDHVTCETGKAFHADTRARPVR